MQEKLKQNKGITLIALVITIIVLLILAGVAIAALTGENGLLERASKTKEETAKSEAIERTRIDIMTQLADNKGDKITGDQLKTILNRYFDNSDVNSISDFTSKTTEIKVKDGEYTVKLADILKGVDIDNTELDPADLYYTTSEHVLFDDDDDAIEQANAFGSYMQEGEYEDFFGEEFMNELESILSEPEYIINEVCPLKVTNYSEELGDLDIGFSFATAYEPDTDVAVAIFCWNGDEPSAENYELTTGIVNDSSIINATISVDTINNISSYDHNVIVIIN